MGTCESIRPTILVGVDGSEGSKTALAWALDEARRLDAELRVVHAWHYPPMYHGAPLAAVADAFAEEGELMLERMMKEVTGGVDVGVPVETEVRRERAAWLLMQLGRHAELLVLGSRGRGGFSALLLGSVSHQCAAHAPCPVVIVPAHRRDDTSSADRRGSRRVARIADRRSMGARRSSPAGSGTSPAAGLGVPRLPLLLGRFPKRPSSRGET